MTINDPRAKQAMYMANNRRPSGVNGGFAKLLYLLVPILAAAALVWAFV